MSDLVMNMNTCPPGQTDNKEAYTMRKRIEEIEEKVKELKEKMNEIHTRHFREDALTQCRDIYSILQYSLEFSIGSLSLEVMLEKLEDWFLKMLTEDDDGQTTNSTSTTCSSSSSSFLSSSVSIPPEQKSAALFNRFIKFREDVEGLSHRRQQYQLQYRLKSALHHILSIEVKDLACRYFLVKPAKGWVDRRLFADEHMKPRPMDTPEDVEEFIAHGIPFLPYKAQPHIKACCEAAQRILKGEVTQHLTWTEHHHH